MNVLNRFWPVLMCILLLPACASGPAFVPEPAAGNQVTIYAFRTSSIVGGGNSDIVAVNDRFVGRLNSGTYTVYRSEPGTIRITRKTGSILGSGQRVGWGLGGFVGLVDGFIEVASFTGSENQTYFVRFPHGKLVPNDAALEMMDGLKNVTPAMN